MIELPHLLFKLPKSLLKQMQIINGLVWLLILVLYGSFLALMYHNQDVKKVEKWQSTQNQLKDHIQQFTQSLHHDAALLQHHNAVLDQFLSISMGDLTLNKSLPSTLKTWVKSSVFSLYDLDGVYMGGLKTPRWH